MVDLNVGVSQSLNLQSLKLLLRFIRGHKVPSRNPVGKEGQRKSQHSCSVPD